MLVFATTVSRGYRIGPGKIFAELMTKLINGHIGLAKKFIWIFL